MGCFVSTFRREPIYRAGMQKSLTPLQQCSIVGPARPSVGRHQPKHSMSTYTQSNRPVLLRSIEPPQYTSEDFKARCTALGIVQSMGSVGDSYGNCMMESAW